MLHTLTLREVRDGLREKKFSSVDLTKAVFEQIHAKNPALNAYVTLTEELAMQQAQEAELQQVPPMVAPKTFLSTINPRMSRSPMLVPR